MRTRTLDVVTDLKLIFHKRAEPIDSFMGF